MSKFLDHVIINPKITLNVGDVYPFIEMGNVSTNYREPVEFELKPFDSGVKFQDGDTVIARITPCLQNGKRFFCKNIGVGFGSTEFLVFRPKNNNELDNRFLYYFMQKDLIVKKMIASMTGATGRQRVNNAVFQSLDVVFPDIDTQRRIADILSAYDDLIENSRKQIKLLEEAAQRLYREWFVDMRFPGHEDTAIVDGVPEGWNINRADSFFEITIGKTPPRAEKKCFVNNGLGIPWVSISDMGQAGIYVHNTSENLTEDAVKKFNVKIVPSGTVMLSFKLTVGRVSIATREMCSNEAIAHFYVDDTLRGYTALYLKFFEYSTLGNTSAISTAINSKIVKSMPFVMPDKNTLETFSKIINTILEMIRIKQTSIHKLTEARDRLLPNLMSGEIKI